MDSGCSRTRGECQTWSSSTERLLSAIDRPPFTIDEEHYIALSQLPLTYPWPSITIDLRPYVPFLERHLVAHLLSGRCGLLPVDVPAHTILDAWLKLLSEAIVHGIFDLHHAAYTPPPLPGPLMSSRFWHAHLNHACTRAVSPLAGAGTTDNMAGDHRKKQIIYCWLHRTNSKCRIPQAKFQPIFHWVRSGGKKVCYCCNRPRMKTNSGVVYLHCRRIQHTAGTLEKATSQKYEVDQNTKKMILE